MKIEELEHINNLIKESHKIGHGIAFLGNERIETPKAFTSGNFASYYDGLLSDELNDSIVSLCRGRLKEKKEAIDN